MTPSMWVATAMWLSMVCGYVLRRNRRRHVPFVLTAILGDIALVLYLEVTRGAVETALEFKLKTLQQVHIGCSLVALLLYFPVLFFAFKLLTGKNEYRRLHKKFALAALCFRTLGFFFMFSMWKS